MLWRHEKIWRPMPKVRVLTYLYICYGDGDWCHSLCARGSNVGSGTAVGQRLHSHTDCQWKMLIVFSCCSSGGAAKCTISHGRQYWNKNVLRFAAHQGSSLFALVVFLYSIYIVRLLLNISTDWVKLHKWQIWHLKIWNPSQLSPHCTLLTLGF